MRPGYRIISRSSLAERRPVDFGSSRRPPHLRQSSVWLDGGLIRWALSSAEGSNAHSRPKRHVLLARFALARYTAQLRAFHVKQYNRTALILIAALATAMAFELASMRWTRPANRRIRMPRRVHLAHVLEGDLFARHDADPRQHRSGSAVSRETLVLAVRSPT